MTAKNAKQTGDAGHWSEAAAERKPHNCQRWTFHAGMATCAHGYELLPDGLARRPARIRWVAHRSAIRQARERARRDG